MIAAVEWGALFELIWVAPVAGLALSFSFSLVILGLSRAESAPPGRSAGWLMVALLGGLAVTGGVAFALKVIIG